MLKCHHMPGVKFCGDCGNRVEDLPSTGTKTTINYHDRGKELRNEEECDIDWCDNDEKDAPEDITKFTEEKSDKAKIEVEDVEPKEPTEFKCNYCSSDLSFDRNKAKYWCTDCKRYRAPELSNYDLTKLEKSKSIMYKIEKEEVTCCACPICYYSLYYDDQYDIHWCNYCQKYIGKEELEKPSRKEYSVPEQYSPGVVQSQKTIAYVLILTGMSLGVISAYLVLWGVLIGFVLSAIVLILTIIFIWMGWKIFDHAIAKEVKHDLRYLKNYVMDSYDPYDSDYRPKKKWMKDMEQCEN